MKIEELKRKLPMPELLTKLGHCAPPMKLAKCPVCERTRFAAYKNTRGEWECKCYSGCVEGDELEFLRIKLNCSRGDALRTYRELCGIPF